MSHPSCLTILLIDDYAEARLELCHFLQQDRLYTYRILEFDSAMQALEWCQQKIPDMILLGFVLPDEDRLKFIQQFRECHSNTQTAVIMLTGQGDEIIAVRAMKSGVQDYVVKDELTAEVLQGAIHHAVERMHLSQQLEQSREQQQLIAAIALQISQSLKLEEILRATITQTRQFLKADRVIVYQFEPDMSGTIVAESVLPGWTVALGRQIRDTCFQQGGGNDYRQGKKQAIDDIYQANLTNCHLHLLETFEVKAHLVVPILVKEQLWGLLIAHQCSASRHWQSAELDLLDQVAVQIVIAIQQANAYEQAQAELVKRQRTEAALKASDEKLQLTLNFADIGYWEWNPITNQIFTENAIHCLYSEPSGANLTYEQWLNQIHPEDQEWVEQEFRQAIATQTDYAVEYRVVWQYGSIHWVSLKGRGLYDETGQLLRMLGVLIDITKHKLSEEERRRAEIPRIELHLLEQILEVVLAGYWDWDIPGNQEYLSLTFKQMFGYEDHELPNTPESWQRLIFPEDLPGVLEVFEQHVQSRGKIPYYNEVRYRHKDGSTVWVICFGHVIAWDQDGTPLRMIGYHIDITQRKQAEAQLRQMNEQLANANVELARATRLKDEFLANMSHELRTPLNAILGISEGLQESVFGSINERQVKAIATIKRSGRHLLELINDILDLSKIESGKLELQLSDVSVRSLCEASLAFVKQMALKKNIRLIIHISENIDSIQVDNRRLRQVLINLLSNAVKFTPEGGSVTLEVRLEGAGEQESRGAGEAGEAGEVNSALSPLSASCFPNLCFHVTDTGIGIAPEEIGKLFQPFIQLDSSLNRQYSGTGLGLALVKQIVILHGGTVSVSSKVGEGSCFTVCIPHHNSDNLPTRQITTLLPNYRFAENAQVLIVEDSVAAADQITRYFNEMGMQPIIYPKGEGAVKEVLRVQPALIILDLQLPNLSGWDVLNQLKTNPKTKDIPAIIISVVDERSKGLAQGAFEYLIKPITRAQLQATINKLQHSVRSESPNLVLPKPALKPPLILLAEDNQANIDTMSGYLEARGYRLILANNGQQAIDLIRVQRPNLIVMDIQMPRMDELEAIRRIRDHRQFVDIPIIALTALAMPGDRETCFAAGANEYLTKPVKLKQLVATIQQLLKR